MTELHSLVNVEIEKSKQHYKTHIAALLGVSRRTVHRRMAESDLSGRALYSTLTDEELDQCVIDIKSRQPHSGYRMVKGLLQAQGLRVQYERVRALFEEPTPFLALSP